MDSMQLNHPDSPGQAGPEPSRRSALRALLIPAGAAILGGCASATRLGDTAPAAHDSGFGTSRLEPDGTRTFKNHLVYDQDGKRLRFQDDLIRGHIFAATFGYSKCRGICGRMAANMQAAADLLGPLMGHPVRFYNFSLAEDTPDEMKEAMEFRGLYGKPGWRYLTASAEVIREIRWSFGFFDVGEEDTLGQPATHTGMVRFGHHPLDKWSSCPALGSPASIAASITWLYPADRRPSVAGLDGELGGGLPIPGFVPPKPLSAQS